MPRPHNPVIWCASCLWRCGLPGCDIEFRTGLGENIGGAIRAALGRNWAPVRKLGGRRETGLSQKRVLTQVAGIKDRAIPPLDQQLIIDIEIAYFNMVRPTKDLCRLIKLAKQRPQSFYYMRRSNHLLKFIEASGATSRRKPAAQ